MTHQISESVIADPSQPDAEASAPCETDAVAPASAAIGGRRSHYCKEIAERVLDQLAAGRPLDAICHDDGMPPRSTVRQWVHDDREGFAARYREACRRAKTTTGPGRPPTYTAACAERLLEQLAAGRTLADICGDPGMPVPGTVWQWVSGNREGFAVRYARARQIGRARVGRHTLYTAELADWILDQLCEGRTLSDLCRDPGMPSRATVQLWVHQDREGFKARYADARITGYHTMADRIIDIADDARGDWITLQRPDGSTKTVINPQNLKRCELQINSRCWLLSKVLPRIYGIAPDPAAQEKDENNLAALLDRAASKAAGIRRTWPDLNSEDGA